MDLWATEHLGAPFDRDGELAARGQVHDPLLRLLLREPYLQRSPPKSTGRELFQREWLQRALDLHPAGVADVQATLCEYTAATIAAAIRELAHVQQPEELLVCGGGAYNRELMRRLALQLPRTTVRDTAARGIAPEHVEAALFAWLAQRFIDGLPGNLTAVTGARAPRVLGAMYRGAVTKP